MKKLILILLLVPLISYGQWIKSSGGTIGGSGIKIFNIGSNSGLSPDSRPGTTYEKEATDYFARMNTQPPDSVKTYINDFIKTLKNTYCTKLNDSTSYSDTTLWQSKDVIVIMGMQDSQAGLLDLKGYKDATAVNSPTFEPWKGFTGSSGKYLNTNYNPNADAVKFARLSNSLSFYSLTNSISAGNMSMGLYGAGIAHSLVCEPLYVPGYSYYPNNCGDILLENLDATSLGYFTNSRTANNKVYFYRNGVIRITATTATTGVSSFPIYLFGVNDGTGVARGTSRQFFYYDIGRGYNQPDVRAYYNALLILKNHLAGQ